MKYEIIDFHTHPFTFHEGNISGYRDYIDLTVENTPQYLKEVGISKIVGSAVSKRDTNFSLAENMLKSNNATIELAEKYEGFLIPGFQVHPACVKESCLEIERMYNKGLRYIGEIVPHGEWCDFSRKEYDEILDTALQYNMMVNLHSTDTDNMEELVKKHPKNIIIAAHPGEKERFLKQLERMRLSENFYLDLSGTGLFRLGVINRGIKEFGAERFLFGTDFPVCSPAMYVGGVAYEPLFTEEEKKLILSENARRLFKECGIEI